MVAAGRMAGGLGKKAKVAVLQPFLKTTAAVGRRGRPGAAPQDQPSASTSYKDACSKLDEAVALVDTLGCEVVLKEVVPLRTVNPKYLFGSGKVSEMSGIVSASDADAVFINAPLSGTQQKALGDQWGGATVLDRFRVILDIFADRARTTEAKLQVELAQLKYESAHLVQSGAAGRDSGYDRQGGGKGMIGGAGEKALEVQRRLLRDRTAEVGKLLKEVEKRRGVQRRTRDRRQEPTVALVGYTNVGKSSLLNRLSYEGKGTGGGGVGKGRAGGIGGKGSVHSKDRVFDTLDPTSRSITLPSMARCVLVDTVGFIQDLPTALIHSFRATLDEVQRADVLLHVRDASSTPRVSEAQRSAVVETLRELGALDIPMLEVWNKADKEQDVDEDEEEIELSSKDSDGDGHTVRPAHIVCALGDGEADYIGVDGVVSATAVHADQVGTAVSEKAAGKAKGNGMEAPEYPAAAGKATMPQFSTRLGKDAPADEKAIRVSAATGDGLDKLLSRVDVVLHMGENSRFTPPPSQRFRYVQTLPGQKRLISKKA